MLLIPCEFCFCGDPSTRAHTSNLMSHPPKAVRYQGEWGWEGSIAANLPIVSENKWVLVAEAEKILRNNLDLWHSNSCFLNKILHKIPMCQNGVKEPTYFNCLILLPTPLSEVPLEANLLNLNAHCL